MTARELIDYLLDYASMNDEVIITKGKEEDFDEYNSDDIDLEECCTNKGCIHLFADFKGDNDE